jgi:hypothetical protein
METQSRTSMPIWEYYVPEHISLYFVDYRDNLDDHSDLINKCVQGNNIYPLSENVFDWWDSPEQYYIEQTRTNLENAGLGYLFDDCYDEICEYIWDHDESNPIEGLLANTRNQVYFYDLGIEVDGWHEAFLCDPWRGESEAQAAAKIRRKLGIKKDTDEAKYKNKLVAEASYGGHLRIYFESQLMDLLTSDERSDFKSIKFKGHFNVAIYNPTSGSGWFEDMDLDCTFRFNRKNLFLSCKDADRYTLEDCFGIFRDWCSRYDAPILSKDVTKSGVCRTSSTSKLAAQEAEYERVFKAGGCSCGDTDIRRHRGVIYINEFPCRNLCPHCGQEWID